MKLIVGLALVAAVCAAPAVLHRPHEHPLRKDFIDTINKAQNSWVAGPNPHFDKMSMDAIIGTLGAWPGMRLPEVEHEIVNAPPASFDSRTQWPNCKSIAEIRDQANCGSCWAFGAVEAITDRICIASNASSAPHISAQDMNSCCTSCGMGCDGGFPAAAWQYWVSTGIVTGGQYGTKQGCAPYSLAHCDHHEPGKYSPCGNIAPTPQCTKQCESGYPKTWSQDKWYGTKAYSVPSNVAQIQTEILTYGPVEAAFTVYADFLTYRSGVYRHVNGTVLGGHAVKILGWGNEGDDYWLVANSWNEDWGDQGYFKILRGSDECGIESGIVAGLAKV